MRTLPRFLGVMSASALLALGLAGVASSQSRGVSWLGVYSQEITPELRDGLSYNGDGVLIQRVVPDSPADDAGLRRGDVITRVGGRAIDSPNELASVIRGYSPGRSVEIQFVRDGRRQTADVRLQTRRDDDTFEAPVPPVPPVPEVAPLPRAPRVEVHRWDDRDDSRDRDDADKDDDDDVLRDLRGHPGMGALPGMRMQMLGRGRLGVRVESLNPDLASYFGSRDTRGALVIEVVDDSPADKADLHPGDVITRLDDTRIESAEDLVKAIGAREQGEVRLSYIRHGQRETAEITLRASQMMRLQTPGMSWQDGGGRTRVFRGPQGTKRIVIRDEKDGKDDAQLRDEIKELKKELEQLRRELNDDDNNNDDDDEE